MRRKTKSRHTVSDVMQAMDRIAPPFLALDWDNIGLAAGNPDARADKVGLSLDATMPALAEARRIEAAMLVTHHPRFFHPLKTLRDDHQAGGRAAAIARSDVAVFSAHTNLDIVPGGTSDALADLAGISDREPVKISATEKLLKLAAFVPVSHIDAVREAVCRAGAGAVGKYSCCTFRAEGIGTFQAGDDTAPFIGRPGSFTEAKEFRLETVAGEYDMPGVLRAMLAAHPYEEAAYDVYQLHGRSGRTFGIGRVGDLAKAESVPSLAARLARATGSKMTQYHAVAAKSARRVAVWAGGGVEVDALVASGAEAVVTGEASFHDVELFAEKNIAVITLGHGHSEEPVLKPVAARLRKELPGVEVTVLRHTGYGMRNV